MVGRGRLAGLCGVTRRRSGDWTAAARRVEERYRHGLLWLARMDRAFRRPGVRAVPYQFTGTSLAATFLLIWAFIGLTMLRDQLLAVRRQRLEEAGFEPAGRVRPSRRRAVRRRRATA